jgi:hypothetical protein
MIRVRPTIEGHQSESSRLAADCVSVDGGGKTITLRRGDEKRATNFDHVFGPSSGQAEIAAHVMPRFVDSCLNGYNGTILGQLKGGEKLVSRSESARSFVGFHSLLCVLLTRFRAAPGAVLLSLRSNRFR